MRDQEPPAQGDPAVDLLSRRRMLTAGLGLGVALATPASALAKVLVRKPSRELSLLNLHTGERLKAEYVHNGQYVPSALHAVSVLLRDHCNNKVHAIDPHLLDLAYAVRARVHSNGQFHIVCGYRSPETNKLMHEVSAGVAAHSLHMSGQAIDIRLPGTQLSAIKKVALGLKLGGVGYYPEDNFVHIDTGTIRRWIG